jgi:tetratricopeptide (TPR) repeat protein
MARRSTSRVQQIEAIPERGLAWRAAVLVIAGALVYVNSLDAPFIFDDVTAVLENQQIRQLWPLSIPLSPPRDTPLAGRPVTNLTFAINYAISGLDARGFHLTNLLIHLLASLTLFGIVRRTLRLPSLAPTFGRQSTNLAWFIALVWMLHPVQTEIIDYVTQRTESLMGLFYLLTLYSSIRALDGSAGRWHTAAILACALGMASKESMMTAPVLVALYDYVFVDRSALQKIGRRRFYLGLAATWLVLAGLLATRPRTSVGFATGVTPWTYLLNQAPMLLTYLRVSFWPRNLVLDYGIPEPLMLTDVLFPALVVVALAALVLVALVRRPRVGFAGAWFFIILSPTSSFVPIATEVGADRRLYLPLAGLIALVVLAVYRAWTTHARTWPQAVGPVAAAIVCLVLAAGTVQRNREYETTLSVIKTTVERRPHPRSNLMYGTALLQAGRRSEAMPYLDRAREDPGSGFILGIDLIAQGQYAAGATELERFIRLRPNHRNAIDAKESLGRAYSVIDRLDEAATHLNDVVRMQPGRGPSHGYLGEVLLRQGRVNDGLREFQIAADLQPGNPDALRLLGIAQGQTGHLEAAVTTLTRAVQMDPLNARGHYLLGTALAASGQVAAAIPHFARAVELNPQDAKAREDLQRAQAYVR